MVASERARRALYARLEEVMGADHAETLMTSLPPTAWTELATKADLRAFEDRLVLRLEAWQDGLRHELRHELGRDLDERLGELDRRVNGKIDALDRKVDGKIDALDRKVDGKFDLLRAEYGRQTRLLFFSQVGTMLTLALILIGAGLVT